MKKGHDPVKGRNYSIRELGSQIEAELSGGSRETLRQLLTKLAAVEEDCEEEAEEGYGGNDFGEASYPGPS